MIPIVIESTTTVIESTLKYPSFLIFRRNSSRVEIKASSLNKSSMKEGSK